jgi:hypothetical protein
MCGNTLDVALDYLIAARQRDRYNLIEDAFRLFDDKVKDPDPKNWYKQGIWVDDYGWWGIALTKAYISAEILGYNDSSKNKLGKYANNCWIGMHTAWDPSVMQNDDQTCVSLAASGTLDSPIVIWLAGIALQTKFIGSSATRHIHA